MPKYNIEYATDYTPLNLRDTDDSDYNITNDQLDILINTYIDSRLKLPGFDTTTPIDVLTKYWKTYKEDARVKIEFNCDGNKKLTEEQYGYITTLTKRSCKDGKFIFYNSVKSSPEDLFAGSQRDLSPNIEISFEDTNTVKFRIIYAISLNINLRIKCGNNSKDFELYAFKDPADLQSGGYEPIGFFEVSRLDNIKEWINIKYDFHIPEFTNYRRVRKNKSELTPREKRAGGKFYKWLPVPGDPTWQNILNNGIYEIYDTKVDKPTLDGVFNPMYDRVNKLVQGYLSLRRHELMNTLDQEVNDDIKKLLDGCNKIEITGYTVLDQWNDKYIGLMSSSGGNNFIEILGQNVPIITDIKDIPIRYEDIK